MPTDFAAKAAALPQTQKDSVSKLTAKMIMLGFPAFFERVEEGAVVCTFFFKPAVGALFSKVLNKEEELAGSLGVESVRIERQLGSISIAVPREDRQTIRFDACLHKMMLSPETAKMQLPLLMGQYPNGEYLYTDLADQPHLLLAGSTGGGKSIFTAQLISSLALFRSPKELEFVLVDTKNLDLVLFKGLSHVKEIITSVEDLRAELERTLAQVRKRTEKMSGLARNIREWNAAGYGEPLDYKVIVIDELADIVQTDDTFWAGVPKKDRPTSILMLLKQITQISRAAGVHFVVATQRPSVKIIDGDIKANFPARICFKVATMQDSRVVLDENGAEKLLGKGDYLFKVAGQDIVKRAHGSYVSMEDIGLLINQHEQIRRSYESVKSTLTQASLSAG